MRHYLRKVRAAGLLGLLKKIVRATRYYIPRLIGRAAFPVLGRRVPLRGYYDKTRDFLQHGDGRYIEFQSASGSLEPTLLDTFRPGIFVAIIPRARSIYDYGLIVSPDHKLLADVSWGGYDAVCRPLQHPAMYKLCFPPIKHVPGRVAVITSLLSHNYYHWMFDILPRFEILQRGGLVPDLYVINTTIPFQKETLQIMNIPSDRILSPTSSTHVEADELIVPSLPGPIFGIAPQLQTCEYLRSTFLQKDRKRKPHRALYVTRTDADRRRVINEAEIREEVLGDGFEIVSLGNLPFLRQVELFSEARIIVGMHGAGFTNAVFCQPDSVLIEFMPEGWRHDHFERLARRVGMEYRSITCTASHVSNCHPSIGDHSIDRYAVRKLLREFA